MFLGKTQNLAKFDDIELSFMETKLQKPEMVKYLGMMLDTKLTFSADIDYLQRKTTGIPRLKMLYKVRKFMSREVS